MAKNLTPTTNCYPKTLDKQHGISDLAPPLEIAHSEDLHSRLSESQDNLISAWGIASLIGTPHLSPP